MDIYLVDGTYELFRHFFALPSAKNQRGDEVGATRGVVSSMLSMIEEGTTHVAIATDHVIESFRNDLWPGYKDGTGIDPDLLSQFPILEDALEAAGFVVWRMIEHEADDGLASGAWMARAEPNVDRIVICTPDKDLAQCVEGDRIVQLDRRRREMRNAAGIKEKFGVPPETIPDYLALVGDSADGFPGVPGWGSKSAAAVLSHYRTIDQIPADAATWGVEVRGKARLAERLVAHREDAELFKRLATLVRDAPVSASVTPLRWPSASRNVEALFNFLGDESLTRRIERLSS